MSENYLEGEVKRRLLCRVTPSLFDLADMILSVAAFIEEPVSTESEL